MTHPLTTHSTPATPAHTHHLDSFLRGVHERLYALRCCTLVRQLVYADCPHAPGYRLSACTTPTPAPHRACALLRCPHLRTHLPLRSAALPPLPTYRLPHLLPHHAFQPHLQRHHTTTRTRAAHAPLPAACIPVPDLHLRAHCLHTHTHTTFYLPSAGTGSRALGIAAATAASSANMRT